MLQVKKPDPPSVRELELLGMMADRLGLEADWAANQKFKSTQTELVEALRKAVAFVDWYHRDAQCTWEEIRRICGHGEN